MTSSQNKAKEALQCSLASAPIVIVGNGPVGVRAAQSLLTQSTYSYITIYGDEPTPSYNRVQLSSYLAGDVSDQQLFNPISIEQTDRLTEYVGRRVTDIDPHNQIIVDDQGHQQKYSKLILATGSSANIPDIPGIKKPNVFTFRSIEDAKMLILHKQSKKHIFIIGSGALGLETAVAMKTEENHVVVGVRDRLLSSYLDNEANTILKERIVSSGVELIINDPIQSLGGVLEVDKIHFKSGRSQTVDTVIICTGIRPNTQLAECAGIKVNKGIVVDDFMQTSVNNIYAIGECAEHMGSTYGVVAPGFEQAETCINHILGEQNAYRGSVNNLQLKVQKHQSSIYGDIDTPPDTSYCYSDRLNGVFRKVLIKGQTIIGYIAIGEWGEQFKLQHCIKTKTAVSINNLKQFQKTGYLWGNQSSLDIQQQADDYILCLCKGITRKEIQTAIQKGYRTMDGVCEKTGAAKTCGSCKPLIAQILDVPAPNLVMKHYKLVYFLSVLSVLLITLIVALPTITPANSVQSSWRIDFLFFDNFWKQTSGYSLLGLCGFAGLLSARKRINKLTLGNLDNWRLFHAAVGVLALIILIFHTGFRLGNNLNLALMLVFLLATTTGSLVGVFMSKNHHWTDLKLREHRKWWSRIHYTLLWLLPALLAYHIFAVYYF